MKKTFQRMVAIMAIGAFVFSSFSFIASPAQPAAEGRNSQAFDWYTGTFTKYSHNNGIEVTVRVEYNPATGISYINDIAYGYGSGFFLPVSHTGTAFVNVNNDLEVSSFRVDFTGDGVTDYVEYSGVLDPIPPLQ